MSDRPKNSPINIPINFVEDARSIDRIEDEPFDDAIEIDGDALSYAAPVDAEIVEPAEDAQGDEADDERDTDTEDVIDADVATTETFALDEVPDTAGDQPSAAAPSASPDTAQTTKGELSMDAFTRLTQELRQKTEQADRAVAEKNDLYDRLLRKQAEFENFRKRTEREMQEAYRRARADILLDILPALDNMERALKHSENADATILHEGLALIYKQLSDALARHGLEAIDSVGNPFDPELHEAVAAEQNDDVEDHTVLDELQRGYKLGDRLLRPARVKVSVQS
jgi:molecular chaperone GrpE